MPFLIVVTPPLGEKVKRHPKFWCYLARCELRSYITGVFQNNLS